MHRDATIWVGRLRIVEGRGTQHRLGVDGSNRRREVRRFGDLHKGHTLIGRTSHVECCFFHDDVLYARFQQERGNANELFAHLLSGPRQRPARYDGGPTRPSANAKRV